MKLVTAEEIRLLDRHAMDDYGVPGVVLMENAGRGAALYFHDFFRSLHPGPLLVVCGKGNNGGDGYVIARHMENLGWKIRVLVLAERKAVSGDARVNLEILLRSGMEVDFAVDAASLAPTLEKMAGMRLIIDAIFGSGLGAEVRGHFAAAIDWINASGAAVGAVDIASGVDAGKGLILGCAVKAACTSTFAFPKVGQMIQPGASHGGKIKTIDIGMPRALLAKVSDRQLFIDAEAAAGFLPERPLTGHKGTFGHLLVVAGAVGKSGAAVLAAEGGLRSGAGLVTAACPAAVHGILEAKLTEAMTAPLPDLQGELSLQAYEKVVSLAEGKKALAMGPGLGAAEETCALVRRLVRHCDIPLVLDADALNALAGHPETLGERKSTHVILTPHPGEMARLVGKTVADIEADRIGAARDFALRFGVVLVLKGAATVTALPDGRVRINGSGNPGMASGGMGDVLTGVIGGLVAQGLDAAAAAVLGVYLHGAAADRLAAEKGVAGLRAGEVAAEVPAVMHDLRKGRGYR
ncbi:MAG: NAD(P)H-hydrate dehydratase [Desulfuromonadaceae bacterium]|nr:NAD(P)H-hydrate dehydratase [Desulfuromonadaceae bacterium]